MLRIDAKTRKVVVHCNTRPSKKEEPISCEWELDFSSCDENLILELAARTVVITQQGKVRKAKVEDRKKLTHCNIDVKAAATPAKPRKTKAEKVAELLAEIGESERKEILKGFSK